MYRTVHLTFLNSTRIIIFKENVNSKLIIFYIGVNKTNKKVKPTHTALNQESAVKKVFKNSGISFAKSGKNRRVN